MQNRSTETEWMDTETVTPEDFAACLADLAAVNTVTLARLPTIAFMRRIARRAPNRPLRVLDVGCGEGDMLRRIHRWGIRAGIALDLVGLDHNAQGIQAARAATPANIPIEYREADIFDPNLLDSSGGPFDVILSALFTHHLSNPEIIRFIAVMEANATRGWFINDLHRHPVADHAFRALSAAARWHRFVQHDGPVSVRRSFTRPDWQALLQAANVPATIRWHAPFRYCVTRFK